MIDFNLFHSFRPSVQNQLSRVPEEAKASQKARERVRDCSTPVFFRIRMVG